MPSLNFLDEFVPGIENGLDVLAGVELRHPGVRPKFQTIRPLRRRAFRVGDVLHLFEKPYRPAMRLVGSPICTRCDALSFNLGGAMSIDGLGVLSQRYDRIAIEDGFEDGPELEAWLCRAFGFPLEAQLISWRVDR